MERLPGTERATEGVGTQRDRSQTRECPCCLRALPRPRRDGYAGKHLDRVWNISGHGWPAGPTSAQSPAANIWPMVPRSGSGCPQSVSGARWRKLGFTRAGARRVPGDCLDLSGEDLERVGPQRPLENRGNRPLKWALGKRRAGHEGPGATESVSEASLGNYSIGRLPGGQGQSRETPGVSGQV